MMSHTSGQHWTATPFVSVSLLIDFPRPAWRPSPASFQWLLADPTVRPLQLPHFVEGIWPLRQQGPKHGGWPQKGRKLEKLFPRRCASRCPERRQLENRDMMGYNGSKTGTLQRTNEKRTAKTWKNMGKNICFMMFRSRKETPFQCVRRQKGASQSPKLRLPAPTGGSSLHLARSWLGPGHRR